MKRVFMRFYVASRDTRAYPQPEYLALLAIVVPLNGIWIQKNSTMYTYCAFIFFPLVKRVTMLPLTV